MLDEKERSEWKIEFPPFIERIYATYRAYVEHEDELINQRLTILIASQSILLAAFGYVLQKMVDSMPPFRQTPAGVDCILLRGYEFGVACWLFLFAFFGIVLALVSLRSILAAKNAIASLCSKWQIVANRYDKPEVSISSVFDESSKAKSAEWQHSYLPDLTGGGAKKAHYWGLRMPQWLPIVFLAMWGAMSGLTIGLGIHRGWIHCEAASSPSTARSCGEKDCAAAGKGQAAVHAPPK